MHRADRDRIFPIQKHCLRTLQRKREFAAGLLAKDGHSQPRNCLIRDVSPAGAQIRIAGIPPVPDEAYLINLRGRLAYHARAVWQRGSLTGLRFEKSYVINKLLPADLEFLRTLLIEANLHQAGQLISQGTELAAALRKCGVTQDL